MYLIQIDNSVPAFFFSNPVFMRQYRLNLRFIFYNLIFTTSVGTNGDDFSQPQDRLQLGLDEYSEINFFSYTANPPSIYQITCNINGKVYIGEAQNLLDRMNQHFKAGSLQNGISNCYELQRDWNLHGKDCFKIQVLLKGEAFLTREKRLDKEIEIINSYEPEQVYNQHLRREIIPQDNYRIVCEINGQRFESIKDASKQLNVSENSIRRRLLNEVPDYVIIEKVRQGYEPIIANGKDYDSIMDSVKAGEAKDRFQAMRRLKSKSRLDLNYRTNPPKKHINKN